MSRLKKVIYDPSCQLNDKYWAIAYGDHGVPLQIVQVIVEQIDVMVNQGIIIWVRRIDDRSQDYWKLSAEDFLKWSAFKTKEEAIVGMNKIILDGGK